jgi:hypothetical protein
MLGLLFGDIGASAIETHFLVRVASRPRERYVSESFDAQIGARSKRFSENESALEGKAEARIEMDCNIRVSVHTQ